MMTVPAGMKPFNLEAAKTGAPCVTRDGRKVVFVSDHYDVKVPEMLVEFCYADLSSANIRVDERGRFYGGLYASPKDVFLLAPEPQVGPLGPVPSLNQKLKDLLKSVDPEYIMFPYDRWDTRVSYAYGQASMHDSSITREQVIAASTEMYGPRPEEPPAPDVVATVVCFSPPPVADRFFDIETDDILGLLFDQQITPKKAHEAICERLAGREPALPEIESAPPAKPKVVQMVSTPNELIALTDDGLLWRDGPHGWERMTGPGE